MFLKIKSEVAERYRKIARPQYWLDQMMEVAEELGHGSVEVRGTILAVMRHDIGCEVAIPGIYLGKNIVTNDGDTYYAQAANPNDTPTNNFGGASGRLACLDATGGTPSKSSNFSSIGAIVGSGNPSAFDSGYPLSNDPDPDNQGAGVDILTYRASFALSEAVGTITRLAIYLSGATGTDPILNYGAFSGGAFTKTSSDSLKAYANHTFNGT